MSRTLLRSLFSFDPRPTSEVEDEMRAEFDAHLAMLEDELAQQGLDPANARAQALARFGDPTRLSREGKAIKLGDRIMLQRINLALLLLVGAAVIFLLVQNQRISNRSVATLEQVAANLAAMQQRQSAPAVQSAPPAAPPQKLVYVSGLVRRPGPYTIPPGGLTMSRLIVSAGGVTDGARTIYVDRDRATERDGVYSVSMLDHLGVDPAIEANDAVTVSEKDDERAPWMIAVQVKGYVSAPTTNRIGERGANLASLLNSPNARPTREATAIRIDRAGSEPWSTTLAIGEALAAPGKAIALKGGDVITALSPEEDAAAPKEWAGYQRSPRVRELILTDRNLLQMVDMREGLDTEWQQRLELGYPVGHEDMKNLRIRAADAEGNIASKVCKAIKPEIDRLITTDPTLSDLLAERERVEAENRESTNRTGRPVNWAARQQEHEINKKILARIEELAPTSTR